MVVGAVFLLALVVRIAVIFETADMPLIRTPQLDSAEYWGWARVLAGHSGVWPAPAPHGPGYPLFLAALLRFGLTMTSIRIVQAVVGAFACCLLALVAKRVSGRLAAAVAGSLAAVYWPLAVVDVSILAESIFTALLLLSFVLAAATRVRPWASLVTGGMVLGVAAVVRPTALALLPVLWILAWSRTVSLRGRVAHVAIATIATLLPIAPVTIANWKASGAFVLVQTNGGMSFYLGNSPRLDGTASARLGGTWDEIYHAAEVAGVRDPVLADRYYVRRTLREIGDAPMAAARLLVRKLALSAGDEEIRDSHSPQFFREHSIALRWGCSFALVFGLALPGFAFGWRRSMIPLAAATLLLLATNVGMVVGARYRLPFAAFLIVFAGVGVAAFLTALNDRRWRQLLTASSLAIAGAGLSLAIGHPPSRNFSEEWVFTGQSLVAEQRYAEAIEAYDRAIALDPENALAWNGAAIAEDRRGNRASASALVQKAAALNPHDGSIRHTIAQLAEERGDVSRARDEYAEALRLSPDSRPSLERLLELQLRTNDLAGAERTLMQLTQRWPNEETWWLQLASIRGALQRPAEGAQAARRALAIDRQNGEAWAIVAALDGDAGRREDAVAALRQSAMLLGKTDQRVVRTAQRLRVPLDAIAQ